MEVYKIEDDELEVKELVLAQDEIVLEVLAKAGIADFDQLSEIPIGQFILKLKEEKLLRKFFAAIVSPRGSAFDETEFEATMKTIGKATNTQLEGMFKDFLSVNKPFLGRLSGYMERLFKIPEKIENWLGSVGSSFTSSSAEANTGDAKKSG